jgi:hypothetical protein
LGLAGENVPQVGLPSIIANWIESAVQALSSLWAHPVAAQDET